MKHAICLLAFKDKEYVHQFIDQFENHPDIEFYIHWHNHNQNECDELKQYSQNIKYVINDFNTTRFSVDLIFAELQLYTKAIENPDICMCHLYSESDYIICPPQYLIDFYNEKLNCNFLSYVTDDILVNKRQFTIFDYKHRAYKASQWKSLNITTIKLLLQQIPLLTTLISEAYEMAMRFRIPGALDEFVIPTILKSECDIDTNLEHSMHYVNWVKCIGHPNTLSLNLLSAPSSYNINYDDILNNIAIRKIDIKDPKSKEFLRLIRKKFTEKHNQ